MWAEDKSKGCALGEEQHRRGRGQRKERCLKQGGALDRSAVARSGRAIAAGNARRCSKADLMLESTVSPVPVSGGSERQSQAKPVLVATRAISGRPAEVAARRLSHYCKADAQCHSTPFALVMACVGGSELARAGPAPSSYPHRLQRRLRQKTRARQRVGAGHSLICCTTFACRLTFSRTGRVSIRLKSTSASSHTPPWCCGSCANCPGSPGLQTGHLQSVPHPPRVD